MRMASVPGTTHAITILGEPARRRMRELCADADQAAVRARIVVQKAHDRGDQSPVIDETYMLVIGAVAAGPVLVSPAALPSHVSGALEEFSHILALLRNAHRSPAMMGVPAVLTCALAHGWLQSTALHARLFQATD